jgi:hypothetical protein
VVAMKYLLLSLTMLVGCVNARDEYNDFGDRIPDAALQIDAEPFTTLPNIDGEFYTVAEYLDTDRYFRFITTNDFAGVTENTGRLNWTAIALDRDTLEPVGEPFVADDIPVNSDGTADIPLIGKLVGRANSVSGSDADLDAIIHAQVRSADFVCGDLTGSAGPSPVDGSTFGSIRIPPGEPLPEMIARCEDGP